MAKKIETVVLLYDSMCKVIEKKDFPSKKEAKEYAIQMYENRKCYFWRDIPKSDYSPYETYRAKVIPSK